MVAVVATIAAVQIDDARHDADNNAIAANDAADAAKKDRDGALRAEREGKEKLLQSLISEAKASRFSRRVGQRFYTLAAVQKATLLARELGKPPATFDELRNLAIAALALPDMQPDTAWYRPPTDPDIVWGEPIPNHKNARVAVPHQQGAGAAFAG